MRFVKNCWVTLVGGVYGMLLAGTVYGFGSFSASLKSVLKLDDRTKQLIGVCGNLGLWVNVIGGMLSRRFGPAPTILSGTALATAGYAGMYAFLNSHQTAEARHGSDTMSSSAIVPCICWFAVGLGAGGRTSQRCSPCRQLRTAQPQLRHRRAHSGVWRLFSIFAVLKEGWLGTASHDSWLYRHLVFFLGCVCASCMANIPQAQSNNASAAISRA